VTRAWSWPRISIKCRG